nr:tRNA (adenosine(37)-N6)-threonylcarbamoyltransferase complex dimerization subunit type 1 TsaB [Cellulomonas sp. APG4]
MSIDTSGEIAVAVVDPRGPRVLAERRSPERRHAELLAPLVVEVLGEAAVARSDLEAVVVGTGPAPFTGLRAGLVTARTLALALAVPVHGVPSLDALGAAALAAHPDAREVLVLSDARRRELYAARYRRVDGATRDAITVVAGPLVDRPDALVQAGLADGAVVVGPGAPLYADVLGVEPREPAHVDLGVLAALARARTERGEATPTEPLYLRRPDVAPSAARKRVTG